MNTYNKSDAPHPRERCPQCSSLVETVSEDPLEEFGLEAGCDYHAAEYLGGEIKERFQTP